MVLCNAFHPDIRVYKEAKYLAGRGHSMTILALDRKGEFLDSPIVDLDGIHIVRFFCRDPRLDNKIKTSRIWGRLKILVYFLWYRSFIRQIRGYLKEHPCDYLHCHDLDGIVAGWLARPGKTPLVFDMHELYEEQTASITKIRLVMRGFVNFMQNRCRGIIAVHPRQAMHMSRNNKKKLVMLPNYPDLNMFEGVRHVPAEKLRVNYIGAVRGQTALFLKLFEACKDLPDVEVAIHGDGGDYPALKKMEPGYRNVTIVGKFDGSKDSARLYSNTDVLYICYDFNNKLKSTQPVKFFEALCSCTPIITQAGTYMGDFSQEHCTGFAIDIYSIDEIRSCIRELAYNRQKLTDTMANIEKVKYLFDWNHIVRNLDGIYSLPTMKT
jgi:glycosyltransferase involved in cell wall biosynthesis